jgi:CspA family cold shock protein
MFWGRGVAVEIDSKAFSPSMQRIPNSGGLSRIRVELLTAYELPGSGIARNVNCPDFDLIRDIMVVSKRCGAPSHRTALSLNKRHECELTAIAVSAPMPGQSTFMLALLRSLGPDQVEVRPGCPTCRADGSRRIKTGDGQRMANGTVKWFNTTKGYGFIMPGDGGKDVFVHITAVQAAGLRGLNDGQKVTFDVVMERGKAAATNLKLA